mgnify:CR=1 FL=1
MTLNFKHFLQSRGVDINLFIQNCTPEFQRWSTDRPHFTDTHSSVYGLRKDEPIEWLQNAFLWDNSLQRDIDWLEIDNEWEDLITDERYTKLIFGLDTPPQLHTRI